MELDIEKIKYYSVPYILKVRGRHWIFYTLYPNTYEEEPAPAEEWAGLPWYIVPHMTRWGVFAFEVDLNGNYFIVTICPQLAIEMILKGVWPTDVTDVTIVLKTLPQVAIDVHKDGVANLRKWMENVKRNPRPYVEASEQLYQCTHSMSM
jgi:hypothetical protein